MKSKYIEEIVVQWFSNKEYKWQCIQLVSMYEWEFWTINFKGSYDLEFIYIYQLLCTKFTISIYCIEFVCARIYESLMKTTISNKSDKQANKGYTSWRTISFTRLFTYALYSLCFILVIQWFICDRILSSYIYSNDSNDWRLNNHLMYYCKVHNFS